MSRIYLSEEEAFTMASMYYTYIKKHHSTIAQAANHFKCPMSTLHKRLDKLEVIERTDARNIAYENKLRHQVELTKMKRSKGGNK